MRVTFQPVPARNPPNQKLLVYIMVWTKERSISKTQLAVFQKYWKKCISSRQAANSWMANSFRRHSSNKINSSRQTKNAYRKIKYQFSNKSIQHCDKCSLLRLIQLRRAVDCVHNQWTQLKMHCKIQSYY